MLLSWMTQNIHPEPTDTLDELSLDWMKQNWGTIISEDTQQRIV